MPRYGTQTVASFIKDVQTNPAMTILDARSNASVRGKPLEFMRGISSALKVHKNIKKLILRDCELADSAMEVLAEILADNHVIEELDLQNNKITSMGAATLCCGLSLNRGVKILNLQGQPGRFEGDPLEQFVRMYSMNVTLQKISLSVDERNASKLSKLMTRNVEIAKRRAAGKDIQDLLPVAVPFDGLVLRTSKSDMTGVCATCGTAGPRLMKNQSCGHTVCESCWIKSAEAQLPHCRAEQQLRLKCCGPSCDEAIDPWVWRYCCSKSEVLSAFHAERSAEIMRFESTAKETLLWASSSVESGPMCTICGERHLCLLENAVCGHSACEDCWTKWTEVQLPKSRGARERSLCCIGSSCRESAMSVWPHVCTRSSEVNGFEKVMVQRQRVQRNPLFPPAVQVECPRAECLGLGYLGSDMVMCFMCEHQWTPDASAPEEEAKMDLMLGEKKCPKCKAPIIKNGGCDHMTCRCKHEFWWSTLEPYTLRRA